MRYAIAAAVVLAILAGVVILGGGSGEDGPALRTGFARAPLFDDGQAEVNTYDAVILREGAPRTTRAYTIFVAEDLDPNSLVKAEDWRRPGLLRAFKYELLFKAQTGMSEFREAVNGFVAADGWRTVKLLYSAQDWCGVTFKSFFPEGRDARLEWTSYWERDGGSGSRVLRGAGGAVPLDVFPAWIRGMALEPESEFRTKVLPTLQGSRVGRPDAVPATISVGAIEEANVPAGRFRAIPVRVDGGEVDAVYHVEEAFPHRIVKWTDSLGQEFVLVRSQRSAYWRHVADGDEERLEP